MLMKATKSKWGIADGKERMMGSTDLFLKLNKSPPLVNSSFFRINFGVIHAKKSGMWKKMLVSYLLVYEKVRGDHQKKTGSDGLNGEGRATSFDSWRKEAGLNIFF
jgi:hypothetical protein